MRWPLALPSASTTAGRSLAPVRLLPMNSTRSGAAAEAVAAAKTARAAAEKNARRNISGVIFEHRTIRWNDSSMRSFLLLLGAAAVIPAGAQDVDPGKLVFETRCARCHGADGS